MSFWEDQRVVVTGGNGFLGSFIVEKLQDKGCRVICAPTSSECNLLNLDEISSLLHHVMPTKVIHAAGRVGGIGANSANPATYFYHNMQMGMNVIRRVAEIDADLVLIGTTCSYPKHCPIPFKEMDLYKGFPEETNSPYGIAKRALFSMARAYAKQYGMRCINLIPSNLYGPRDHFDPRVSHVIPAIIRKIDEAKKRGKDTVTLWGTGSPTREFTYAEDAAEGILAASEATTDEEIPMNIGTGLEIAIKRLAWTIGKLMGGIDFEWDETKPDGQPRRCLDMTRTFRITGWKAQTSMEDGLRKTIEWYRSQE